jgi:5-methylcytosine-specific restriction endonuclease McrA
MLIVNKENNTTIEQITRLPQILALNSAGVPLEWISYERSAYYHATGKIKWTMGQHEVILRGGTNAITGQQSRLVLDTIVALDYQKNPSSHRKLSPTLSNKTLFERDRYICAYCGTNCKSSDLTRDHVHPQSRGGLDTWENCVSACYGCNQYKEDKTPEEAEMPLLFVPYTPSFNEYLILRNRNILQDQMEFLMKGVSKHSRLHLH